MISIFHKTIKLSENNYVDNQEVIRELHSEIYLILRLPKELQEKFNTVKDHIKKKLPDIDGNYAGCAHVTVQRYMAGSNIEDVQRVAKLWVEKFKPFSVRLGKLSTRLGTATLVNFPFETTDDLTQSLRQLREMSKEAELDYEDEITADEWTFHMSVVFFGEAKDEVHNKIFQSLKTKGFDENIRFLISEAELVTYRDGKEYSAGVFSFKNPRKST